ncbi:MAG: MATE family efflux transporter [Spirochaetales bacterium]|nr:MAG: MATE family efflux transporter [Spirochaetales bacterium]
MLDTVMVGRLGTAELAAVGLGNQVWFLLLLFIFGVSTGAGVFTSQYWGKRDMAGIRRCTGLSLTIGLSASLVFMVASMIFPKAILGLYTADPEVLELGARYLRLVAPSYPLAAASFVFAVALRGVERVRLPLVATTIALSANAFLNYVLIFGAFGFPRLGVAGAAIATVVSRAMEAGVTIIGAYAMKTPPAGRLAELLAWGGGFVPRFLRIASPVILNEVAWSMGITTYNAVFARVGTQAIAAYNVTATVSQLAMVFFLGSANAAAVMLGKRIGQGDRETAFAWARRFAILSPSLGLAMGLLLAPVSLVLPFLFPIGPEPLRQAGLMVIVLAAYFPFKVFNLHVVVGICRSGGDTRFGAFFDIAGVWGLGVPLAFVGAFVLHLESWQVFALLNVEELAKAFLGIWRLRSRKWLNDVTD